MGKIALFIAGDERIYFPALVALLSIKKHNPGVFDLFMCFDKSKLTIEMKESLLENEIYFIDNQALEEFDVERSFSVMSEGKWPIEVFYNYVLPVHLGNMGYEFSIKADYDILCTSPYILDEIVPTGKTLGGLCSKVDIVKEGVTQKALDLLRTQGRFREQISDYMNVGFITFNNKKYIENDCYKKFIEIYRFLAENTPQAKLLEQIAFSVLLYELKGDYIKVPESYNHRVLWTRAVQNDLTFDTKNIHYITQFKPWKPIELDKLKWFLHRNNGCLFSYRNLWLEFAEALPNFALHCEERRLSELQLAGLQMFIVKNSNERVYKLEKELREVKAALAATEAAKAK